MKDKIIKKQDELITKIQKANNWMFIRLNDLDSFSEYVKIKDEISALESELTSLKAQSVEREELDKGWKELENSGLDKPFIPIHPTSEVKEVSAGLSIMTSERIKEIQQATAYPESISVQQALLHVWNECEQYHQEQIREELFPDIHVYQETYCGKCGKLL